MGFFVEPEIVWVEFTGQFKGWKVALKSEMDAGDQEELENTMFQVTMDGESEKTPRPTLRAGSLKLLELNILKIVNPEGQEILPTPAKIRSLNRGIREKLLNKIRELNRPLAELEKAI